MVALASPFLAALAGRNDGPPPLWMMRQAGRTLASYRALRSGVDFLDFCKSEARAAEATLIPIRELGVDAAILFADIMLPIEALGTSLRFEEKIGPIVEPALTDESVLAGLTALPVEQAVAYLPPIIRRIRAELPAHVPLIGFAPSPWTLAAYAVEGRARRGFPALKRWLWSDPAGFGRLLDRLTDLLIAYGRMQIEAGVQAFQVFDTWAELLPPATFDAVLKPRLARQLAALDVPRIYFPKGTAAFIESCADLPCEGLGCDWTVELKDVRRRLPGKALQGNLDPTVLYAPPAAIREATWRMLDTMAGDRGYIVNLGHGLQPDIPEAHVHAFVEAVRGWKG